MDSVEGFKVAVAVEVSAAAIVASEEAAAADSVAAEIAALVRKTVMARLPMLQRVQALVVAMEEIAIAIATDRVVGMIREAAVAHLMTDATAAALAIETDAAAPISNPCEASDNTAITTVLGMMTAENEDMKAVTKTRANFGATKHSALLVETNPMSWWVSSVLSLSPLLFSAFLLPFITRGKQGVR
ncbi:hypothetical protein F5Y15DRAFT_139859 [Xylariaceae sp. FL0016]|nr:hypothetical protein F5Y15DRAFT_139859 [Xylariaceae sp. FL0016]